MKKFILIIFLTTGSINASFSQSIIRDLVSSDPGYKDTLYPIDKSFKKCDSTWRTNTEWGKCLGDHISMWETYMKQTYDTIISMADTAGQRIVKKSQDCWQKSFDEEKHLAGYIMFLPNAGFGHGDYLKMYYSELSEVRSRALELESCLAYIIAAKKEKEKENTGKH